MIMYLEINLLRLFNLIYLHPQHPDQKQRNRLKNPNCWGVCGAGFADAGSDGIVVSAAAAADISNSICSVINSLSTASVWSLLNSITASMRFLITPVVRSV